MANTVPLRWPSLALIILAAFRTFKLFPFVRRLVGFRGGLGLFGVSWKTLYFRVRPGGFELRFGVFDTGGTNIPY